MSEKFRRRFSTLVWKAWLACPLPIQNRVRNSRALSRLKSLVARNARLHVDHNLFYKRRYFEEIEKWSRPGVAAMAQTIIREFQPRFVVDVGCGSGLLLQALANAGVEAIGFEYSDDAIALCQERGLQVMKFDIEGNTPIPLKGDVTLSMEVAEHLPEKCADKFVEMLTGVADRVVFTAAIPGQGGDDHVNEQPNSYWIVKFAKRGFELDLERTSSWKREWASKEVASWYQNNLMIFRKRNA